MTQLLQTLQRSLRIEKHNLVLGLLQSSRKTTEPNTQARTPQHDSGHDGQRERCGNTWEPHLIQTEKLQGRWGEAPWGEASGEVMPEQLSPRGGACVCALGGQQEGVWDAQGGGRQRTACRNRQRKQTMGRSLWGPQNRLHPGREVYT